MTNAQLTDIFSVHYITMVHYACRITKSRQVAEDVVQGVFERLVSMKRLPSKSYLYRIVRNDSINCTRHDDHHSIYLDTLQSDPIDEEYFESELFAHIARALRGLPPQTRKVVTMRFWGGLTNPQIAGKLGISVHTVRNQLVRGLKLLRHDKSFKT